MANAVLQLTTYNLIDAYQNKTCLWDTTKNATEEEKELAWSRLSVLFGTSVGNIRSTLHCLFVGCIIYFSSSAFRCSLTLLYFSLHVHDGWEWLYKIHNKSKCCTTSPQQVHNKSNKWSLTLSLHAR